MSSGLAACSSGFSPAAEKSRTAAAAGWRLGPEKDLDRKTTPYLVPWDQLADAVKEYDRNAAGETLKAILKLGYMIGEPK